MWRLQESWFLYFHLLILILLPWLSLPLSFTPPYCSHGDLRIDRAIPNLTPEETGKVSHLKKLIVLVRHGSRTPYGKLTCWKDYDTIWTDCGVTEMIVPAGSIDTPLDPPLSMWRFRKLFDGSQNLLGGNCETGQLIKEGYRQELQLGQNLKDKFIGSDDVSRGDFKLFATDDYVQAVNPDRVYFRSDNMQRTLLSAQTLLSGMFPSTSSYSEEVIIDWHTGDYALDQIYPNSRVCPALKSIKDAAMGIRSYTQWMTSSKPLEDTLNLVLGGIDQWNWSNILDCFMTTVCSGRGELPMGVDDQIFNLTVQHVEESFARVALFNNSYWSKMAMQKMTNEMRDEIIKSVKNDEDARKFMLYGAHDTTLMPFLAALLGENWNRKWAPYASMVTIEVYAGGATELEDYFRIVYNGVPQIVPACDSESLCEIRHLLDAMNFGVGECSVDDSFILSQDDQRIVFDSSDYSIILFLTLLLGILLGSLMMKAQMEIFNISDSQRRNFELISDSSFASLSTSTSSQHGRRTHKLGQGQNGVNEDSDEDEIYINTTSHSVQRNLIRHMGDYESKIVDFRV